MSVSAWTIIWTKLSKNWPRVQILNWAQFEWTWKQILMSRLAFSTNLPRESPKSPLSWNQILKGMQKPYWCSNGCKMSKKSTSFWRTQSIHSLRYQKTIRLRVNLLSISSWRTWEIWMYFNSIKKCSKKSKRKKRTTPLVLKLSRSHRNSMLMLMRRTKKRNLKSPSHQHLYPKVKKSKLLIHLKINPL